MVALLVVQSMGQPPRLALNNDDLATIMGITSAIADAHENCDIQVGVATLIDTGRDDEPIIGEINTDADGVFGFIPV